MGMHCKSTGCRTRCWGIALLVVVGIAVLGGVVMLLWNWLVPELFSGGREIGYLQALGLLVLSRILFGGLRGHGRWHHHRWERMTPEEREKFLSARHGCGCGRSGQPEEAGAEESRE